MARRILQALAVLSLLAIGVAIGVHRDWLVDRAARLAPSVAALFGIEVADETGIGDDGVSTTLINSDLLNFDMAIVKGAGPDGDFGGGLGLAKDGLLVAHDRDGAVQFYDWNTGAVSQLAFKLPSLELATLPKTTPSGEAFSDYDMRYHDIELFDRPDGLHVAVTYLHFDPAGACFASRLAEALLPADWREPVAKGAEARLLDWRILSEMTPCIPPTKEVASSHQSGGRIVVESQQSLLLSTGDFSHDGRFGMEHLPQIEGSRWGRVLRINLDSGEVSEVAKGLRNAQGMTFDQAGNLWVTDHGPMGGDELDLIRQGGNYGWPEVTLGVDYAARRTDTRAWLLNPLQGRHEGYDAPSFAWLPSIAPSSIKLVTGFDQRWDGDLLIATLVGEALHRLRMDGTRVLYDETIPIGHRVRDLEIANGSIYMLFDDGSLARLVPRSSPTNG